MGIVYVPRQPHRCEPKANGEQIHGTVYRCAECGSHWVLWRIRGETVWYGEGLYSKLRRLLGRARRVR